MPWVKLDDGFWSDPKVDQAGNEAAGVFARMLSYCGQHLTNGFVPESTARYITSRRKAIEALEAAGLVERIEDGYLITRYLEFNPSREQVEQERAEARERMRRARAKGGRS